MLKRISQKSFALELQKLHFSRKSRRKASFVSFQVFFSDSLNLKSIESHINWTSHQLNLKLIESGSLTSLNQSHIYWTSFIAIESLINWMKSPEIIRIPNQLPFNPIESETNFKSLESSWIAKQLNRKLLESQASWISNQLTFASVESQNNWISKPTECQTRWFSITSIEIQCVRIWKKIEIQWATNHLNLKSIDFRTNSIPHLLPIGSWYFLIFGNFHHRLVR